MKTSVKRIPPPFKPVEVSIVLETSEEWELFWHLFWATLSVPEAAFPTNADKRKQLNALMRGVHESLAGV